MAARNIRDSAALDLRTLVVPGPVDNSPRFELIFTASAISHCACSRITLCSTDPPLRLAQWNCRILRCETVFVVAESDFRQWNSTSSSRPLQLIAEYFDDSSMDMVVVAIYDPEPGCGEHTDERRWQYAQRMVAPNTC